MIVRNYRLLCRNGLNPTTGSALGNFTCWFIRNSDSTQNAHSKQPFRSRSSLFAMECCCTQGVIRCVLDAIVEDSMPITKMCEVLRCFHVRRSTSFSNPSGFAFWCMYFEFTDECFLRDSIVQWCLPFVLVLRDCFLLPLGTSDTVVEEWLYHYCTVLKTCFNNVFVSVSGLLTYVVFHNDCVPTVQLAKRCCGAITSNSPKEFLTRFHF